MKPIVIAEAGLNHNGDLYKAHDMVVKAKVAGADICKFQYYDPEALLGLDSPYLPYVKIAMFNQVQLEGLKRRCDDIGIEFMVSVFDIKDVSWADGLCSTHKVASRKNQDNDFINALLDTDKPVIISTQKINPEPIPGAHYMYCITKYPTPLEDMKALPCNPRLGLSSHCPSIAPSLQAFSQGAMILENHVTESRDLPGCDQTSSITFEELRQLVLFTKQLEVIR